MASIELDEAVVDAEFLTKKLEMSKRIATNRNQRIKLRQELSVYKRVEKTGEKPLEDPKIVQLVINLKSDIDSEMELNSKLIKKLQETNNQMQQTKTQIHDVADLIQRYKVEQTPQVMNESNKLHLAERKKFLSNAIMVKEQRLLELKNDLERLEKESETKNKQHGMLEKLTEWQQGKAVDDSEELYVKLANENYITASEAWHEAKFAYDRKQIMPDFYLQSWRALNHAVETYVLLLAKESTDPEQVKIQEKIDYLYRNKIIVNTKLLDSLEALVDRINHGVEASPAPQYPESIFEFMQKNMSSLKIR